MLALCGCSSASQVDDGAADQTLVEQYSVTVVAEYPHDPDAFTQGLAFSEDGRLFESVGGRGESDVREVDPTSGQVIETAPLAADVFGEGLTVGPDGLVQLTWTSDQAFLRDRDTLAVAKVWPIGGEGWGVAWDDDRGSYITSDGSAVLTFRDRSEFRAQSETEVTLNGEPVEMLNELEMVDGVLYANVWKDDRVLRIDPGTGAVTAEIDAGALLDAAEVTSDQAVLNGIAHRPGDPPNRLWLTGKDWPTMFVVDLAAS